MSLLKKKTQFAYDAVIKCEGVYIYTESGKRLFDTSSGVALCNIGHANSHILNAYKEIDSHVPWVHAGSFLNRHPEYLAEQLLSHAPGLDYALFQTSGSEAVESAIKMGRQYFAEQGKFSKSKILSAGQSYHGYANVSLAVSGNSARKSVLGNMREYRVDTILEPYSPAFNSPHGIEEYDLERLCALSEKIRAIGADNIAAVLFETITGSSNPAVKPSEKFYSAVTEICKENDILIILDEVMCGLGRCGKWFSYINSGITPDIVAVGKGLAAGYAPISAVLINDRVYDAIDQNSGAFTIGQTYNNYPISCFIASKVLSLLEEGDLVCQSNEKGSFLLSKLEASLVDVNVRRIQNHGLFLGIEFHQFDNVLEPMNHTKNYGEKMSVIGKQNGLYLYPCQGSVEHRTGNSLLLAPPLIATEDELSDCADRLAESIKDFMAREQAQSGRP